MKIFLPQRNRAVYNGLQPTKTKIFYHGFFSHEYFQPLTFPKLRYITESVLPDSECEFHQGQSCTDMIFVAHQLVKKTRKYKSTFVLFVDLNNALCECRRSCVPPVLLSIICSFYVDMSAAILVKGHHSDSFTVRNGVWQGCTIIPVLFNVYFCAMVEVSAFRLEWPFAIIMVLCWLEIAFPRDIC